MTIFALAETTECVYFVEIEQDKKEFRNKKSCCSAFKSPPVSGFFAGYSSLTVIYSLMKDEFISGHD